PVLAHRCAKHRLTFWTLHLRAQPVERHPHEVFARWASDDFGFRRHISVAPVRANTSEELGYGRGPTETLHMPEWLAGHLPQGWTAWHLVAASAGLGVGMALISLVGVGYALARLPADYFVNPDARRPIDRHPVLKALVAVVRNAFGYVLIALGIV